MFKDDEGVFHYESQEEVNTLLEAGDADTTEAVMSGMIKIDGFTGDPEPVVEENVEEVVEEVIEETPAENPEPVVEPEPVVSDNSEETEEMLKALKAEIEAANKAREEEKLELLKQIEELKKPIEEPEPVAEPDLDIELEDEDPDLATDFEKNTRKIFEAEIKKIKQSNSGSQVQASAIKTLEEKLEQVLSANQKALEEQQAEQNRKIIFREIDDFSKGKNNLEIPMGIGDAREEQYQLKEDIAKALEINIDADPWEVERVYRRVAAEDSVLARKQRSILESKGIQIPEYTKNYLNLISLFERKNGRRFNKYTGKMEDITDSVGNKSVLPSMEDAYRLSDYYNLVSKASNDASLEVQKKLQEQQETVATIDNSSTSDIDGDSKFTEEEFASLMQIDKQTLLKNPQLLRRYAAAMAKVGVGVAPEIQKALAGLDK